MNVAEHKAGNLQGIVLLLPITMAVMGLVVLIPVQTAMKEHFVGQEALVETMLTLPALCVALLSPFAGMVVDFFGRRTTCIVALVVYAIVGMLPIFLESLSAITASRVGVGVMEALIITSSTTLIGDYFHGKEREKWLANQTALASISSIFLAFLGGMLGATALGWRGPFTAYGLSILFALCILLFTWEPQKSEQPNNEIAGDKAPFPWSAILPIALIAIFGGMMFFAMQIQVTNVLSEYYGVTSADDLGLYAALAGLAVAAGTLLYRVISAPRSVPVQLLIAFGVLGASYIAMNHAPTKGLFTGSLVVNQLGCGMLLPALVVWAMGRLPFEVRGRGTGLFMSGWWIGQPVSVMVVRGLREGTGDSLPAALQILGFLCLAAAAIALINKFRKSALPGAPTAA